GSVGGGFISASGIGAAIGVPAAVASAGLVTAGAGNFTAGLQGLGQALSTGGGGRGTHLDRFNGKKPEYQINPAHDPRSPLFNPRKTPLPDDAEAVFRNAVPDHPVNPKNWYGVNTKGKLYRFANSNDGKAHVNGIEGVGDGIRNITDYALRRLGRK
ncbi:MAG: hypothetical protein HUU21_40235, partial [Polyangiaceae bacterium]|nr:hypothetical protein [Polyangiaceae bacterium]